MKRVFLLTVLLVMTASFGFAQGATVVTKVLSTSGALPETKIEGLNIGSHTVLWSTTGSLTFCQVYMSVATATNAVHSQEGETQDCTASGVYTYADSTARNYIIVGARFTGTGTVTLIYVGEHNSTSTTGLQQTTGIGYFLSTSYNRPRERVVINGFGQMRVDTNPLGYSMQPRCNALRRTNCYVGVQ